MSIRESNEELIPVEPETPAPASDQPEPDRRKFIASIAAGAAALTGLAASLPLKSSILDTVRKEVAANSEQSAAGYTKVSSYSKNGYTKGKNYAKGATSTEEEFDDNGAGPSGTGTA